jgi:hypothetical protein
MPCLVESGTLGTCTELADALELAFVQLAGEVMLPAKRSDSSMTFEALRQELGSRTVVLSDWVHPQNLARVRGGVWDRGEVEMNLRQIEVLVLALRTERLAAARKVWVNPTQQGGFDAGGELDSTRWVLEAYGGVNVRNNRKLVADAQALSGAAPGSTRFFACRPAAWVMKGKTSRSKAGTFRLLNDPLVEGVMLFEFEPLSNGVH